MSVCYCCNKILNKRNQSFEHIIPNSIGGRLKSARLICRDCNNAYGMTIDAALAKDFENLVTFFNIERDRTKEKLPDIDLGSIEKNFHEDDLLPNHDLSISFSVDNDLVMRSVAKIAVNYYLMKIRGLRYLRKIIDVINGVERNSYHIHYHHTPEAKWESNEVSHVIVIKGNAFSRQLYANVVLFNTYSFVVNLCNDYDGNDVDLFYRYDILRKKISYII